MPTAEELLRIAGQPDHPSRIKALPRYQQHIGDNLTPYGRKIFEEYAGIPSADVEAHIYKVRDLAWDVLPWPCIGEFWFISFGLSRHPHYQQLVRLLTSSSGSRILDVGTCVGQDLRALHVDGVPISALFGMDALPGFETVGHALFKDEDRFTKEHYIVGDILDLSGSLAETKGTWSALNMIMFLHMFNMEDAEKACTSALQLLRPEAGSLVVGAQTGTTKPMELVLKPPMCEPGEHKTIYRHSKETLVELWERAAEKLGVKIKATAEYDEEEIARRERGVREDPDWEFKNRGFSGPNERRIYFTVEII
ncbi:methyltransferase domain-containing protein [Rutstroemia sp. NJR-2017a WRK4]|nr:methyltransferase domain-containing protein [Rutstroemia sp. NJR-2017a WRK4]